MSRWERELEEMARELGDKLTPEAVVDRARSANSALHSMFSWDDADAAEKYRLLQARGLIRRVVVHLEPHKPNEPPVRAYLNVDRGSREYVAVSVVQSSPEATRAVIAHLLIDLRSVQARLLRYADALDASDELRASIDKFLARNERKKRAG